MEFTVEEIEVKTDLDPDSDTQEYPVLKNEYWKPNRDMDENVETLDPYFKFKLLVDELLVIFTKCEEKCGICVEHIVNLCQHIGQTHDSGHEHDNSSNSSDSMPQSFHSVKRRIPIRVKNCDDASTNLNASTSSTYIKTLGEETCLEKNPTQDTTLNDEDVDHDNDVIFLSDCDESQTDVHHDNVNNIRSVKKAQQKKRVSNRTRLKQTSCNICGKDFCDRHSLDRHILTHTGEKPFECETCGKCFTRESTLKEHRHIHTGERPYKCDICDSRFRYSTGLRAHKLNVNCGRKQSHDRNREVILKAHKCLKCGKMFKKMCDLNAHRTVHTGKGHRFHCGVCGKGFLYNSLLVRHKSTHTRGKQLKASQTLSLLKARKIQSNYNRNKSRIDALKHPIKTPQFTHTGEKLFNCVECGKGFSYKCNLVRHKLTHSGEKNLGCDTCGKRFHDSRDFRAHKMGYKCKRAKSHNVSAKLPSRPKHKCLTCGKMFERVHELNRHRVIHTRGTLRCEMCGQFFRHAGHFKRHVQAHIK